MRLFFIIVGLLISNHLYSAATVLVEVIHDNQTKVSLRDAALHDYLVYEPIFDFPEKTTFGLDDGSFTLLELTIGKDVYFLYMQGSFITIDLKTAKIKSDAYFLFKREKDFFTTNVNGKWLLHLFEIEKFYRNILNQVDSLIIIDDNYGFSKSDVKYWDKKSSKRMLNYLNDLDYDDQDFMLRYNSPAFIDFSELLHKLAYQYSGKDIHTTLAIEEQYRKISDECIPIAKDAITLHHFFRPSSPLVVMESALSSPEANSLDPRLLYSANNATKLKRKRHDYSSGLELDWLFGFDVDEALNTFFKKQDVKKPSLIVFWTTFGSAMDYEYHHLRELYAQHHQKYNFIYVCVNAYEQEQKARAIIRREGLSGYHLFPKSSDAFWKSEWKNRRINTLPFYVLVDAEEKLVDAIEIPLDFSKLLPQEMELFISEKKI